MFPSVCLALLELEDETVAFGDLPVWICALCTFLTVSTTYGPPCSSVEGAERSPVPPAVVHPCTFQKPASALVREHVLVRLDSAGFLLVLLSQRGVAALG